LVMGTMAGAMLLAVAAKFRAEGDNLGVVSAVLDTNFWLSTHVVMITIGYATSLMTGFLAHVYLIERVRGQPEALLNTLSSHIRAMSYVALFTTATGTILGGIWADQSWGRFWGWDPKENGALLIVLWILFVLHGRFAGRVHDLGAAVLFAFMIVIVACAWFGVNLLGVGLHSYGFTQGATFGLLALMGAEILGIGGLYIMCRVRGHHAV
jgi:ABC-type transport system involved in cytochrome c biogenesis permease subunit